MQRLEALRRHRAVVLPPDRVFDRWRAHDVLVGRRPAGELARGHQKRASAAELALAPQNRQLDERGLGEVVEDLAKALDALVLETATWVYTSCSHRCAPSLRSSSRNNARNDAFVRVGLTVTSFFTLKKTGAPVG
jgi:hypothetical protein